MQQPDVSTPARRAAVRIEDRIRRDAIETAALSFLVETEDGTLLRKAAEDLRPDDRVVIDGPQAFRSLEAAQAVLAAEVAAAGGLDAWRSGAGDQESNGPSSAAP